jgi:uncharacterized repeat protein (TIGR02543 family)
MMRSHARLFMSIAIVLLFTAVAAYGQTSISPGSTAANATIRCISLDWPCTGDSDHDATCATQYRVLGSGTWLDAMPLMRCDNSDHNGFYGSIFNLNANTTYEVKLTITDPDGGGDTTTFNVPTRAVPAQPTGGSTYHVVPGSGGGTGSSSNPFKGIAAAEAAAQPGDIFLLHAGDYGLAQLTKAGTADNWIVWKAAGDGNAIIQGMYVKAYIWVDGLYFQLGSQHLQNNDWVNYGRSTALTTPDGSSATGVCVTRCTFRDFFHTLKCHGNTWYVADNDIRGDRDPISGGLQGEGVELGKSGNDIVCYNKFRRNSDAISYPGKNTDIYGNDIQDCSDDAVETDSGKSNVRIFENKITNPYHSMFSFQPMTYGPWYFVRNQLIMSANKPWKFSLDVDDRFVVAHNTFVCPTRESEYGQCLLNALHKNNLHISYTTSGNVLYGGWKSGTTGPGVSSTPFWMTDWDYNGWDCGGKATPFRWFGTDYSSFASFAAGLGVDPHGVTVDRTQIFSNWVVPSTTYDYTPPDYQLASGTNAAVDAGVYMPNINDGYSGTAPDLGWIERGASAPQYGIRPLGSTYTLTVTSGSGDGAYYQGQVISISADAPPQGYVFDEWTGATAYVANVNSANTTVTMPAQNITVTATYVSAPTYTLTVTSGTGDGSYTQGTVVNIAANTPPGGYIFDEWTGATQYIADVNDPTTTVTMPAQNITVTATYVAVYTLTVTSGTGDGSYTQGAVVNIAADTPPPGDMFNEWTGATQYIDDIYSASTTVTMPASNITVTATYTSGTEYTLTVNSGSGDGDYTYQTVVQIVADAPATHYHFVAWTGDVSYVANVNSSTTTVTMPEQNVTVTATYAEDPQYTLTVNSGTGDGNYYQGTVVNIAADAAPTDYTFSQWSGDVVYVGNAYSPSTTVTMPAQNVTVTASYSPVGGGETFQESSGMVVMEAEHYSSKATGVGSYTAYNWALNTTTSGDSGDSMQALPNTGVNAGTATDGPVMDFKINFSTTGVYYIHARMPALGGTDDSINVGMDDTLVQSQLANWTGAWAWMKATATTTISSTGLHTFNVWMREDGVILDKLILTTNASYSLSGTDTGPAESPTSGAPATYTLTVNSGSGTGEYEEDEVVGISADAPSANYHFVAWTGDTAYVANINSDVTTVTMPAEDISVTATYAEDPQYTLTVNSGTGDGSYYEGQVVNIVADAPAQGYLFDEWTGSVAYVANVNSASTTVTMPASNITVTATYEAVPTYTLTVTSGTGDGTYPATQVVNIVADAPAAHYHFDEWTGDVAYVANVNSASTTVTMPASNITVTATYEEDPQYALTVTSGSGDGSYYEDEEVGITADAPQSGYAFSAWTGDVAYVANVNSSSATVTMPAQAVSVTATYSSTSGDTFQESGGLVVMEAEHYSSKEIGTGAADTHTWESEEITGDSGSSMVAEPNVGVNCGDTGTYGPVLNFKINFSTTGVYYQFIRMPILGGTDNGINVGMDDSITSSNVYHTAGEWRWAVVPNTITVSSTGLHTFHIWMREDGNTVDKILLSTDENDRPGTGDDTGPAESPINGVPVYTLTVVSGSGDGEYEEDEVVGITADAPPANYHFSAWTGATAYVANVNSSSTTVTMPSQNISVTATYAEDTKYTLTVNSGTGDGSYYEDQVVEITADAPPANYHFVAWTGSTAYVANVNSSTTTVTMPAQNISVTATYAEDSQYTLTVNSGTGDGTYYVGTVVNITADTPPNGYNFDKWTGDTAGVANIYVDATTITIPDSNATVTATYIPILYVLTVVNGSGDGSYTEDTVVDIVADAPGTGYLFDKWIGDTAYVANVNSSSTTVTMPAFNVVVTASYEPILYTLTVVSGSGDGSYEMNDVVDIVADAPQTGYQFSKWTGDTATVADVLDSSTTITMPAANATVTATYVATGSGDTFQESSGMVVMEAEHYSSKAVGIGSYASKSWDLNTTTSGDSGDSMQVLPNGGSNALDAITGPVMNFKVNFSTTGTYYVLVRFPPLPGVDSRVNLGLDGNFVVYAQQPSTTDWGWIKKSPFTVSSTGIHTLNVWMRLDGVIADKIIMTTNSSYTLTGTDTGPSESSRQ